MSDKDSLLDSLREELRELEKQRVNLPSETLPYLDNIIADAKKLVERIEQEQVLFSKLDTNLTSVSSLVSDSTQRALSRHRCKTIRDVTRLKEADVRLRGGLRVVLELNRLLNPHGLSLGMTDKDLNAYETKQNLAKSTPDK